MIRQNRRYVNVENVGPKDLKILSNKLLEKRQRVLQQSMDLQRKIMNAPKDRPRMKTMISDSAVSIRESESASDTSMNSQISESMRNI